MTHEQIVSALSQYENQAWPDVIDKNSAAYVISLQLALKAVGFDPGKIDALYGNNTKAAVEAFQQSSWLTVDGWAGPYTMQKLIAKLGWTPKELTPDARPVSTPAEAAPVAPEVVSENPKDLVEALTKRPLTAFDKKWLKDNLGVADITKIPLYQSGCNGVAYFMSDGNIWIVTQAWWFSEWKWWYKYADWDKYVWEWKNDVKEWKGTYMYKNWDKYVWEWKNGNRHWKGTYYYADGRIGRDGTYKNDEYVAWTEKIQEKTPEKTFPLEQLNDVNMKQIWEKYIAPEYTSKRQKDWLKRKWVDKWVKVLIQNAYWNQSISLNGLNWTRLLTISDLKSVGDGKNINLVKFVAVVKKTLWDSMTKEYKAETLTADNALVQKSIEDTYLAFDKVFTDADRKNPIIAKQIEKLQSYFSNKDQLLLDDTSVIVKGNKKYIQIDLDNKGEDKPWTENILIPYEKGIVNGKFQLWTFQQAVRKYIVEELFSKKDHTDIFTKIKDQNIKLDL